jgi:hypothetical protein
MMPSLPFSTTAIEAALNLISAGLFVEAYLRPPRGWYGSRWLALLLNSVLLLNVTLFAYNFIGLVIR